MTRRAIRYWSIVGFFGLAAAAILVRYASLAAEKGEGSKQAAVELERGSIKDRRGRVLALDSPLYNIAVWRPETVAASFPSDAARLAKLLDLDPSEIEERWRDGDADFFYIKKRVQPQTARAVQEAKASGACAGIVVEKVAGRLYPEKRLAAHLVGFVGDGNRGLAGVEAKYQDFLSPAADGKGRARGATSASNGPALPASAGETGRGADIYLSIDADLQFSLEEVARKAIGGTGAQAVMLLASDVRTGEILAYVAMPDFDPNEYFAAPPESWYDWPSVYAYEPGSVFKVFSMASVLDTGAIDLSDSFYCDGAYRRTAPSGEKIVIKCLGAHGAVNVARILEYSCNAGAGYAADEVQALDFYERLRAFGFGSRTGSALAGESAGQLRSPESWSLRSKPTIAMGQEILVTALQMTAAANAVANGGTLLKPVVVRRIVSSSGESLLDNAPQAVCRVISERTSRAILDAMESAAGEEGTGKRAKVKDVRMAVKTGTAQMIDPDTRRYSERDFIASTLAILPADAPRVAIYLAIVKPRGESYYGGRIAAPYVKDAAEALLSVMDLPRGESPEVVHPGTVTLPATRAVAIGDTMPDLRGTPKRLLVPLLAREDIKVRIVGDGYVARQRPGPGERVAPGAEILLELE